MAEKLSPLHELSLVSCALQLIGCDGAWTTIVVIVVGHLLPPTSKGFAADVHTIWEVFIKTLPLTLAVAMIVVAFRRGHRNIYTYATILVASYFVSICLGWGQPIPQLPVAQSTSDNGILAYASSVLRCYQAGYGLPLFAKSIFLGCVFGCKVS